MKDQLDLIDVPPYWRELWQGMPEYVMDHKEPWKSLTVHFRSVNDLREFARKTGYLHGDGKRSRITEKTKSVWFPREESKKRQKYTGTKISPRYPVYIISKGRADTRLTVKALNRLKVPYHVVIEPQEFEAYSTVIPENKILVLPFSDLGQGSIPARNWVWNHSIELGYKRHWILDDNIDGFVRQNRNARIAMDTAAGFCAIEDWVDRYENVAMAGMNYRFLGGGTASETIPALLLNTRIYSCILLDNDTPFRWRGRYNEDTDLSLRILKSGRCTALFNAFKCNKQATMTMSGGNSDELYDAEIGGRLLMAQSLQDQHPQEVRITQKWGRFQHHVDYSSFKNNALIPKKSVVLPTEPNEYGLTLIDE